MPEEANKKPSKRELDLDLLGSVPLGSEADKQLDVIERSLAPALRHQQRVVELMRPYLEVGVEIRRGFNEATAQIGSAIAKFNEGFGPVLAGIAETLKHFPERMRGNLLALAKEGWYIDPEWSLPTSFQLEKELLNGSKEKVAQWIMDSYRERLDEIERMLCEEHPHRASIIAKAIAAHRNGDYELSIPVFIIQADGIANDRHERELYSRNPSRGLGGLGLSERIFTVPLIEATPINATEKERGSDFSGLNRHLVLHGIDVNYASEENSLKALSLINYASFALRRSE